MSGLETWPATHHAFTLPLRYHLSGPADAGVVVCLHGYQDHALSMLRRLGWWQRELPFRVLAINAPFPVPIWTSEGFTEAYAWYFRDATRGLEVGSPTMVAAHIAALLRHVGVIDRPAVIFGFSQGAFLAPALAAEIPDVRAIIGLGGGFPPELYAGLPRLNVYGIHGGADERVPLEPARAAHAALMSERFGGEFFEIPDLRHRITPHEEPLVRRLVEENLA